MPARKPAWKLMVFLAAFTLEQALLAGGMLYVVFYVPTFAEARPLVLWVGLPFMLVLGAAITWVNIQSHFHPELDEESE